MFRMEISEYDHIIQLFKGGGEQNRFYRLSKTSSPSTRGNFNENYKIDSINAGLERRARNKEQSEIHMFPRDHDKSCPFVSFCGYPLQLLKSVIRTKDDLSLN